LASAPRPDRIGSAAFVPGELTRGDLPLAQHIDGPVSAPVMIATGSRPGPTLWVQAAVHGGEVGGTLGLARFLERVELSTMAGAVIGILAANPLAFQAQARNTPQDGENMNRVFPGSLSGTITRQMARRLFETARTTADMVVDLHSGGAEATVPFYTLYWDDGSPASAAARALAVSAGTATVWAARDEWLSGALIVQLTRSGTPALIVESGGGAALEDGEIESFASAIESIARAGGLLPGSPGSAREPTMIGSCDLVFTKEGGFFVPRCRPGQIVEGGERIGEVVDVFGQVRERISSGKRAFVAALGRPYLPVHSGAMIAELNDIVSHGGA
jgi:predicted deacylase